MRVIIIEDWQRFLCYWRSTTPVPRFVHPFPRHPQSYQNTCVWSQPMVDYLRTEGIRFTVDRAELGRLAAEKLGVTLAAR